MLYNFIVFYAENAQQQICCDLKSGRSSWVSKDLKIAHIEVQDKRDVEETFQNIIGFTHRIIDIQESTYERLPS